jgi:hypothetical protein
MESYFLKNYDPRHWVFQLLSGQLSVDLDLTNAQALHYLKEARLGESLRGKREAKEENNICI